MPRLYPPRDEHLRPAVTFLTPADTELLPSDLNLGYKSLLVFLILLKCLEFQRAVGKGRGRQLYLGNPGGLGSASVGCRRRGRAGHHPTVPLYLAHSTPHGFSLPGIRIPVVSRSPRLPANKHPEFPGRMVRSDPLQELIPLPRAGGRETRQEGSKQSPGKLSSPAGCSGRSRCCCGGKGNRGWLVAGRGG